MPLDFEYLATLSFREFLHFLEERREKNRKEYESQGDLGLFVLSPPPSCNSGGEGFCQRFAHPRDSGIRVRNFTGLNPAPAANFPNFAEGKFSTALSPAGGRLQTTSEGKMPAENHAIGSGDQGENKQPPPSPMTMEIK